ncbi:MAG: hypothetical protein AAF483_24575 [Planctomycetota bacterium]
MGGSAITFHRQDSILELEDLLWSKYDEERAFGIRAASAWLAVDTLPLLDRQIVIPKGTVNEAVLFYNDFRPAADYPADVWGSEVESFTDIVEWVALHQHFKDLLAAEKVSDTLGKQINDWITRSRHIKEQVGRIASHETIESNPLRQEEELRAKLRRIESLLNDHQSLLKDFESTRSDLITRCSQLTKQMNVQAKAVCAQAKENLSTEESKQYIAKAILIEFAKKQWHDLSNCASLGYLMANNFPKRDRKEFDQTWHLGRNQNGEFFKAENITAKGVFAYGESRDPFRLVAEFDLKDSQQDILTTNWEYTFSRPDEMVGMTVRTEADENHLELFSTRHASESLSASDRIAAAEELPSCETLAQESLLARITAITRQGELEASLEFSSEALPPEILELQAAQLESPEEFPLTVRVSGTWRDPEFQLTSKMPNWYVELVDKTVQEKLAAKTTLGSNDMQSDFEGFVTQIQNNLNLSLQEALNTIQGNGEQLAVAGKGIQGRLREVTGESLTADRETGSGLLR